ncbi:MAG: hypothetical protein P8Q92_01195 [Pseudoprimorskyibacter sp.]|nr:hypothetical protein [Pseudoprimorskyibacter sp.]
MKFKFIADDQDALPINRLCEIVNVILRGYRVYRSRPLSHSQCRDLGDQVHICEQFALSLGSYGRPKMTE